MGKSATKWKDAGVWAIYSTPEPTCPRPGIMHSSTWDQKISANILQETSSASRTLHSLMGAGLRGLNGIVPTISLHYILYLCSPQAILSGLESTIVTQPEIAELGEISQASPASFQHPPIRITTEAIYALIGALLPLEAYLDFTCFTFLASIVQTKDTNYVEESIRREHGKTAHNAAKDKLVHI